MAIVIEQEQNSYVHLQYKNDVMVNCLKCRREDTNVGASNADINLKRECMTQAFISKREQIMIILTELACAVFKFILNDFEFYVDNYSPLSKDLMIVPVEIVGSRKG